MWINHQCRLNMFFSLQVIHPPSLFFNFLSLPYILPFSLLSSFPNTIPPLASLPVTLHISEYRGVQAIVATI